MCDGAKDFLATNCEADYAYIELAIDFGPPYAIRTKSPLDYGLCANFEMPTTSAIGDTRNRLPQRSEFRSPGLSTITTWSEKSNY